MEVFDLKLTQFEGSNQFSIEFLLIMNFSSADERLRRVPDER